METELERIVNLHKEYVCNIIGVSDESQKVWNQARAKRPPVNFWDPPRKWMRANDLERYQKLETILKDYERRISECIARAFLYVVQNPSTKWKRIPCTGAKGSSSETNSRHYRTELDDGDGYEIQISWYNYPEDTGGVGSPESYRESFYVFITGDKKLKIPWRSRRWWRNKYQEFPYYVLSVRYDEDMRLEIDKGLATLDEASQKKVQSVLIELMRSVKNKLG